MRVAINLYSEEKLYKWVTEADTHSVDEDVTGFQIDRVDTDSNESKTLPK